MFNQYILGYCFIMMSTEGTMKQSITTCEPAVRGGKPKCELPAAGGSTVRGDNPKGAAGRPKKSKKTRRGGRGNGSGDGGISFGV